MHAEGAEAPGPAAAQADPAAGVADAPAPAPVLAQQARILGTEDVTPLFRCSRCKLPAHLSCLVKTYPAAAYKAIDEQPSSRRVLASPEFYTGHWTCFECWKWPKTVDAILTFRDLPLAATAGELQADGQRNSVTREYYVKFLGVSHRWNEWVPARWVEGQRESQGKLGVFLRERVNAWQSFTAGVVVQPGGAKAKPVIAAVNPDFLRVERVLDVQVKRSKHNGVDGKRVEEIKRLDLDKDIESVYVKWLGLPYDASTWELVPVSGLPPEGLDGDKVYKLKVDAEMYPSFVEAFDEYKKRNMIGSIGEEKPCTRDPNFYEFESQPDYIVGGSLKDYQIDGLNWLVYQWFNTQGCILADEMGLGKTLQIVSFLSTLYTGNNYFPFLILAPSITIGHWLDEFHKWAPNMVVVHYTGSKTDRQMIREYEIFRPKSSSSTLRYRFHVLLSSYESMMQESQLFKEIPFAVLVCDEGHRLKNDESRTFRQLMNNITVQHKVVLSGTPLQNNMREMFNLLNFLDPEQYSDPKDLASKFGIENIKSDDTIIPKIHKFLRPLFLRRTKKEVLTFLPPKAEILVPCPLTPVQRELYKAVLAKNFDLLRSIGVQSGQTETKAVPLKNILMELRKICNHPYLGSSNLEPPDTSAADLHKLMVDASGKFSLLQPMLRKLHTRGHRVLIFSQFKIVLDIVEDFLNGENYEYLRIDGETPTSQRHSMINSFNSPDSKHFVFLLTTRTGGTGINLTSADTVIIYDSDWNPHQDIQAVARVHRIGQTKPVLIYKLFTRDTVECEHAASIIERSTSKLVLDKIVVGALDEENVDTKQLSSILKVGARKLFDESTDQESSALKFDDAAVERLIDRDRIIEEEQEKEKAIAVAQAASKNTEDEAGAEARENATKSSFSFAKVWILDAEAAAAEKAKEDDVMETEEQGEDESDENFWERLLQGRIETAVQNFDDSMILGKRRRVAVNYREARRNRPDIQLELEADDASDEYAPEDDSAQESASDASEMEDDALEFKGLSSNAETQWVPWKTFTNRLDPFKARPYLPSESQRIAKCWLCLKQSCRYREHCEKAADANFLKTLLDGLTSVINRPAKPNTDLSSLRFKIRIVTRLLTHAMTLSNANSIQQKSRDDYLAHPRKRMTGPSAPAGEPRQSQSVAALNHVVPAANIKLDEKSLKKLRDFNAQLQELRKMLQKEASPPNSIVPTAGAVHTADFIDLTESPTLPTAPVQVPAVVPTSSIMPAIAASAPLPASTIASNVGPPVLGHPQTAPSTNAASKPALPPIAPSQILKSHPEVPSQIHRLDPQLSVQTARISGASLGQRLLASNSPTLSRPLLANQLNQQLLSDFASPPLANSPVNLKGNAPQQFLSTEPAQLVQQPTHPAQKQLSQNIGNFAIQSHQQILSQQHLFATPSQLQFQPQFAQAPQACLQQIQQQPRQPQYGQISAPQVQILPTQQTSYSLSNPQNTSPHALLQLPQQSQTMPVNLQNLSQHPLLQPPISMLGGISSNSSESGYVDPICWFCGETGHTPESCMKVHPQNIDNTCFEYLEAYFKSGKLPANRYNALRSLAHSRLEQKQSYAREAAARIAQTF
ncbi:P-loop containing nucleoside triphosphate hydrolase protein [Chytriomyces sp. MP71]|nr:P-loop containing nucleoside triphosphate hydrolase protein [Chytriomyces sp. MP71]